MGSTLTTLTTVSELNQIVGCLVDVWRTGELAGVGKDTHTFCIRVKTAQAVSVNMECIMHNPVTQQFHFYGHTLPRCVHVKQYIFIAMLFIKVHSGS